MDERQRLVIGVGTAVAAVLALVVGLLALGARDDGDGELVAGSTTTSALESTTTLALLPVEGGPPLTSTTTSSSTTTTAAARTTTSAAGPVISAGGAVLEAPAGSLTRQADGDDSCASVGSGGTMTVEGCETWSAGGTRLRWLAERDAVTSARRVAVLRHARDDVWTVVLVADGEPGLWSEVAVRVADVDDDGDDEAVAGFRLAGTGRILAVDVVDGAGEVAAHLDLDHGSVRVSSGQLDAWRAEFGPDDPNCCPSRFIHDLVRGRRGTYRLVSSRAEGESDVPPSQL